MAKTQQEPQYYISEINTQVMNYNVYVMNLGEKLMYMAILLVAGGAIGLVFYGGLFKVEGVATFMTTISNIVVFFGIGALAIKAFLPMINDSLKKKRATVLKEQFVDFASALTNALGSGMNMNDSVNAVYLDLKSQYPEDAYIVAEVRELVDGLNNNLSIEFLLEQFGIRSGEEDIMNFAQVFSTCYRTGGDIKSVVRRTTEMISEKVMIASEIETAITSNKMQMNVMNVLPIVIILMMRVMSAEFANSFSSIVGVIGLTFSAGLTFAAYKMGQKIMDIKG